MTTLLDLAREAGFQVGSKGIAAADAINWVEVSAELTKFAALVEERVRREAAQDCIALCEDQDEPDWYGYYNPNTFGDGRGACIRAIEAKHLTGEKGRK